METALVQPKTKLWTGGKSPFNVSYGKLMMWYFLMSDSFTFGAFLISYGTIRFSQNVWADPNHVFNAFPLAGHANLPLAFVSLMTFILILSSVTMVLGVHEGQYEPQRRGKMAFFYYTWRACFSKLPGMGMDPFIDIETPGFGRWKNRRMGNHSYSQSMGPCDSGHDA